jgi:hypothetical protein
LLCFFDFHAQVFNDRSMKFKLFDVVLGAVLEHAHRLMV